LIRPAVFSLSRRSRLALPTLVALLLVAGGAAAAAWWWLAQPLALPATPFAFDVKPGQSVKAIARELAAANVLPAEWPLVALARWRGVDRTIKAGNYEIEQGVTLPGLLDRLSQGEVTQTSLTIVEGSTFGELRSQLAEAPDVAKNAAALPDVPFKDPYEALILASIVEKETGRPADRPLIASVLVNRLKAGMRLQADPTVIYAMGKRFDGDLRKRDLETDSPYNTYTRDGLPPTPIALPGQASLDAATNPPVTPYLYFVARGDGTSEFSANLADHNRAVAKFQKGSR
jgi:UPF0755 protein